MACFLVVLEIRNALKVDRDPANVDNGKQVHNSEPYANNGKYFQKNGILLNADRVCDKERCINQLTETDDKQGNDQIGYHRRGMVAARRKVYVKA